MGVLWIVLLSVYVWEVSSQTPQCQSVPANGECVCGDSEVHSYCSPNSQCAPDDYESYCRTNSRFASEHVLPDDWVLMFDSRDYQNLIGQTLLTKDEDNDGGQWTQRGGICQYDLRACSFSSGPQNNWFFTRHIKYPPGSVAGFNTEVYLNITFRFSQCTGNPACPNDYATLYRYDTNSIVSSTVRTNPGNYVLLFGSGTETTDSRLQQVGNTDITAVRSFVAPGDKGFYLGVRDSGTCGQIGRIYLYYTPCKKMQDGLVNYPEVVRPPNGSPPNVAQACCAPNSHNTNSLTIRAYSVSDGRCDRYGDVVCVCDVGYKLDPSGTTCSACPAGTYRSSTDPQNQCRNCPMNTEMELVGVLICPCVDGYFRDGQTNEGPEVDCTPPPDPVTNLRATVIRDISVTLSWTRPSVTGRNDFYYTVEYDDPDNTGQFLHADPNNVNYINSATFVSYRVPRTGSGVSLRPDTPYTIRVTTHNGVSDQDSENDVRRASLQIRTMEGVPSVPQTVRSLSGVVVWGSPAQPNGLITGYDVRFSSSSQTNPIIPKGPTESYHIVSDEDIAGLGSSVRVQVRARTSVGPGPWSSPQQYGGSTCPPMTTCPTPTPCATCPPTPSTPPTCPPTPPPTDCPPVTCLTCPTTMPPCPTTTPPNVGPSVKFMLNGRTYLDDDVVLITEIGEGDNALLCMTDKTDCCAGSQAAGEFYYPDNSIVSVRASGNSLYRNRGAGFIRLNRRNEAMSPLGRYRCSIPDPNGVMQDIYINIATAMSPTVTTCPPTQQPSDCPTVTCSTCPTTIPPTTCPTQTCPTCPPVTCPPPTTCPTAITCPTCLTMIPTDPTEPSPGIKFMLNERTYLNDDVVLITEIGEGDNALLCMTDKTDCCAGSQAAGEFYYPDNSIVSVRASGNSLYRNRGAGFIRLNRRNEAMSPLGRYRCSIPDPNGVMQDIYINIATAMSPTVTTCPPTQQPSDCPTVTCSTCPTTIPPTTCPTQTCPTCPPVTCPPPTTCPTAITCPTCLTMIPTDPTEPSPGIKFMLNERTYLNDDVVLITEIGEGDNALLCMTDKTDCCAGSQAAGEFYYPDNSIVSVRASGNSLYRNRGAGFIRLNRRNEAMSPLGRYRCSIPDPNGVMQDIYINIATAMSPTVTTCPPTQQPSDCPTITCSTCPTTIPPTTCPTQTCPTCPPVTCPPPTTCPTAITCPTCLTMIPTDPTEPNPGLKFMLNERTYLNDDVVLITEIGEGDNALLCMTDKTDCCTDSQAAGEFYYPDNSIVSVRASRNSLYRNRGAGFIRLNRRNEAMSPLGRYRCSIPDSNGVMQNIYINIASTTPVTARPPPPGPTSCAPSKTCNTCPTITTCPKLKTCPTCPPKVVCPQITCPSTTKIPSVPDTNVSFMIGGKTYHNNDVIRMSEIGEGTNALLCVTSATNCCKPPYGVKQGEMFYPNNTVIGFSNVNSLYRNRGPQVVRLNRRNDNHTPTGKYRCQIPGPNGDIQNIYINVT